MAFSNASYSNIVDVVSQNAQYLANGYFSLGVVPVGISALKQISVEQQPKFCEFVSYVDKHFVLSSKMTNLYHKIPTIVAGSIYFVHQEDTAKDLSVEELATLAKYSITQPVDFYEKSPTVFTKDVLETVVKKTSDFFSRDSLMYLVDEAFSRGDTAEDVIQKISNVSLDELLQEAFIAEGQQVEKELQNEGRRF